MLFYIPPFSCNQENTSRCHFWCGVRPERSSSLCRKAEVRARSVAVAPGEAVVCQTNEMGAWVGTDPCYILVQHSRGRRFRDPPAGSVLEEHDRTDQPNSSRNPRSRSGLLERGRQGPRCDCTNPRMSDLEGGVHIAVLFVGRP